IPDPSPADTVAVVQIANPYDEPIPLFDKVIGPNGQVQWLPRYKIRLFGQEFPLSPSINPQTEGRVSSLRGLINAGSDADALDAGLLVDSSVNFNTKHGMVLPPATNDRPYTLTIVSVPAARIDEFDDSRKRWSFFMEDGTTSTRGELDQWIDFLDLGLDDGILSSPTNGLLPQQTFQFEGEDYNVAQTDLIWVVRPAIDPAGDGAFDPNNASDDWDRDENDDVRELWATNRLYYDGKQDPWTEFNGDADLPIPYAWDATDERRSFLQKTVDDSGVTTLTPKHTAVELVKVDRLDFNGDLNYNDSLTNASIPLPGGGSFEYRYEYGDEPVNPNTGEFSLMFENSDGGYPAQEIVIDRTLQQREDGTWHDPLMESIVGLEWGKSYNSGTGDEVVDFDEVFSGSLAASRLPSLDENPDWIDWQTSRTSYQDGTPQYGNITRTWVTDGDLSDRSYYPIIWHGHNSPKPQSMQLGQSFDEMNSIPGTPTNLYPGWIDQSGYRDGKAASARFAQWARYARPWGLDPDWTGVNLDDDRFFDGSNPVEPNLAQTWDRSSPEFQMDYSAPRYVLGRGAVTRSHSAPWFIRDADEQLTNEEIPDLADQTMPLVDRDYVEIAREAGLAKPELGSTRYVEQRIVEGARGGPASINRFEDGKGHNVDVYIIDNDNSTGVNQDFENNYSVSDEYPTLRDYMESRSGGLADDASAKHYEHFEIASKLSSYGDPSGQLDPDGDFTGGSYASNSHWPWLTRNARLPRYIADPDAPLGNFAYIYRNRKPTAFDMIAAENNAGWDNVNRWSFPDKGVYAVDETPAFDATASNYIYDVDSNGGYRYDENHLAPYSFQMNHKNGNFEQIGEVLNVWTHAHMISQPYRDYEYPGQPQFIPRPDPRVQAQTLRTFSESLSRELDETLENARGPISYKVQLDVESGGSGGIGSCSDPDTNRYAYRDLMRDALRRVGRLEVSPDAYGRQQLVGEPARDLASEGSQTLPDRLEPWVLPNTDLSHLEPIQPAGQRVLDLFVCDGPGVYDLFDNGSYENGTFVTVPDGIIDPENAYQEFTSRDPSFKNAHAFSGKGTPGLVNINTASLEVLRTLPHMYRMVHGTDGIGGIDDVLDVDFSGSNPANRNPRVAVPEAMIQYRDQLGVHPTDDGPTRSAPFVGGKQVVLQDGFQSSLDSDRNGIIQPYEYGLNPGLDLGPSYAMRGAHTPVHHRGDSPRTDTANLTLDYFDRTDAGYDAFNDWTYEADGIATGSGVRGFQGIGELFQLQSSGYRGNPVHTNIGNTGEEDVLGLQGDRIDPNAWSIEFAAKRPFMFSRQESDDDNVYVDEYDESPFQDGRFAFNDIGAAISTDTSTIRDARQQFNDVQYLHGKSHAWSDLADGDSRKRERLLSGDMVAGDAEEANLLFSGLSNMITTRSDMFTVHFRVRTFKPNPETGVWDATDRDSIVDDSRYVMLVDRSEVENPGDQPRIVYMEKIDN
ncbi:MAG: hypothetical protein P8J89_03980, partial [Phycisphaerales bacterium]|nr:hypothetical protein [Phycisphaerales bacterium]